MRIEKLTPEQEAQLPGIRDEWIAIGLNCDPCDFDESIKHGNIAYKSANLEEPGIAYITEGPLAAAILASTLRVIENQGGVTKVLEKYDNCRTPNMKNAAKGFGEAPWKSARRSATKWRKNGAMDSTEYQLTGDVLNIIWTKHLDEVLADLSNCVSEQSCGSHDAGWLSFYDTFRRFGLEDVVEPMNGVIELAKVCGWWSPYEKVVIYQDRHYILHRDEDGRLHCEDGPAVGYRDGFFIWAIHGVHVPQHVVEAPETITLEEIKSEQNAEVRRIMVEQFGPTKYIRATGAELVDADERTSIGGGPRALYKLDDGSQWLVAADGSTDRVYFMPVPDEVKTCKEAHEAIACVNEDDFVMEG